MAACPPLRRLAASMLAVSVATINAPAAAQDVESIPAPVLINVPQTAELASGTGETASAQIYLPEFFARFAPRNALDMLERVPGFTIQGGGNGGGNGGGRGLGQASENVLVNGERLPGKSDSARDQLARIPADKVVRIEIVDGTALDVPGLTGQTANIIVEGGGLSGQFKWRGGYRPLVDQSELYGFDMSVSGSAGRLDYTLALANQNGRFGSSGASLINDAAGNLIETQDTRNTGNFDEPSASANLKYDFGGDMKGNLNLSYSREYFDRDEQEFLFGAGLVDRNLSSNRRNREYDYEIGADLEFPLGPGTLKLIALNGAKNQDFANTVTTSFADDTSDTGDRFAFTGDSGERIARGEYSWGMFSADWQLSGEAAFNRLDNVARLFSLDADGNFAELDFPEGTGGVREKRFESILSFSKQISPKLAFQATAGGEISRIEQTGSAANSRDFKRPKGSASLAWKPEKGLDISLEISRTVGQLSFGDFLARVFLDDGNANSGNNELVPEQSWDTKLQVNKTLGPWGSTTFAVQRRAIEDYIDLIPLTGGGEARGNIDRARRTEIDWDSTFNLDPLGLKGARVEARAELVKSRVRDPLDDALRPFSGQRDYRINIEYRHDIPGSQIAYGSGLSNSRNGRYFRIGEIGRSWEGPTFLSTFIEHKDVFGLTVNASASNLVDGRDRFVRTVYDGVRTEDPVLFTENRNRKIGPIFRFSVAGNF